MRPLIVKNGQVQQLDFLTIGARTQVNLISQSISVTSSFHSVFSAANANLVNVLGGTTGQVLILTGTASGDISVRDNTGNLRLAGNFTLSTNQDTIVMIYDGSVWLELCRSNNG